MSSVKLIQNWEYFKGLGWRFCKMEDLGAALLTFTLTRASVFVLFCQPPNAFPPWLHLHLIHIFPPSGHHWGSAGQGAEVGFGGGWAWEDLHRQPHLGSRMYYVYMWSLTFSSQLRSKNDDDTNYQTLSFSSGRRGTPGTKFRSVPKKKLQRSIWCGVLSAESFNDHLIADIALSFICFFFVDRCVLAWMPWWAWASSTLRMTCRGQTGSAPTSGSLFNDDDDDDDDQSK